MKHKRNETYTIHTIRNIIILLLINFNNTNSSQRNVEVGSSLTVRKSQSHTVLVCDQKIE